MPYAINQQGGWRSVDGESGLVDGEIFSESLPSDDDLPSSFRLSKELRHLSDQYKIDLDQYRLLWTSISITDGSNEETRKINLRTQWTARTAQYSADVASTKLKYQ